MDFAVWGEIVAWGVYIGRVNTMCVGLGGLMSTAASIVSIGLRAHAMQAYTAKLKISTVTKTHIAHPSRGKLACPEAA